MAYDAKAVANYFLDLAKASGDLISPMKLQKLVYYAHGWYAGFHGRPLINESIEAWQYGPVVPSLYHEFKRFGSEPITAKATDLDTEFNLSEVSPPDDSATRRFLESIWVNYGKLTGVKLSEMTHADGGPWHIARAANPGVRGVDIPFEVIAKHFKQAVENSKERRSAKA